MFGRILSTMLFALALLGFVSAPSARVSGAAQQDASSAAAQSPHFKAQSAPASKAAPGEAADLLLEDLEIDDRDDAVVLTVVVAGASLIVSSTVAVARSPATPRQDLGAGVPFRRRAFSSRAPPTR